MMIKTIKTKNAKNELKEFIQNNNYTNNNYANIKPSVSDSLQTITFGFTLEKSMKLIKKVRNLRT